MFGFEVNGLLGLLWLGVIVWAILRTAESYASTTAKALWIVALLVLPIIGFIAWLIFGPRHGRRRAY